MAILDIVLPVFVVIGLGYALRRRGILHAQANAAVSRLVFYVAAPSLLFHSTAQESFDWGISLPVLAVVGGITVLLALGVYLACGRMPPDRRGVFAQGAHRTNMVFMGVPLLLNAYGSAGMAHAAVLIAFMVIVYSLLSVPLLILPHEKRSARDPRVWTDTLWRIAINPLVIGCGGGLIYALFFDRLPVTVERSLGMVGAIASPLGLICVGAEMDFGKLRAELAPAAAAAAVKLVAYPLLVFVALRGLGLQGLAVAVPVLLMACPTAVVSYIMAREMRGSAQLAAAIVIGTMAASLVTLIGWLAVLSRF